MARVRIRGLKGPGLARGLLIWGLVLAGLSGAFFPWIWREPVALQLTAPGLAEFIKFLPEVRYGQVPVQRLFFLLPLFFALLGLPLISENRCLALPVGVRWLLRLTVVPLALAALSPVWTPAILTAPEFRLQTGLAVSAVLLAVAAPYLGALPFRLLVALLLIGGLAAITLPWWQFGLIQPGMVEAYGQPVTLGWGWWLGVVGILVSLTGALWLAFWKNEPQTRYDPTS